MKSKFKIDLDNIVNVFKGGLKTAEDTIEPKVTYGVIDVEIEMSLRDSMMCGILIIDSSSEFTRVIRESFKRIRDFARMRISTKGAEHDELKEIINQIELTFIDIFESVEIIFEKWLRTMKDDATFRIKSNFLNTEIIIFADEIEDLNVEEILEYLKKSLEHLSMMLVKASSEAERWVEILPEIIEHNLNEDGVAYNVPQWIIARIKINDFIISTTKSGFGNEIRLKNTQDDQSKPNDQDDPNIDTEWFVRGDKDDMVFTDEDHVESSNC